MKHIVLSFLIGLLVLSSCSDWLDIQPKTEVKEDKMFETESGFKDALIGCYMLMGDSLIYGREITYNFLEVLAQQYEFETTLHPYRYVKEYAYSDKTVQNKIDNIWSRMYRVIANVNAILESIETHKDVLHPTNYANIKAEALGLRAFLHFDLMRYFCEHIGLSPDAGGIPYAYTFDLKNKELFTLKECYENVLEDLTIAQHLLVNDTSQVTTEYRGTTYNFVTLPAVYAMKARVFHYEGQLDSAGIYAEKVMQFSNYHLVTSPTEIPDIEKYPGGSEMIWGLGTTKLYDVLFDEFQADPVTSFELMRPREDVEEIYKDVNWDAQNHDYRFDNFFEKEDRGWVFNRLLKVDRESPDDIEEQKKNTKGICMLRLPEMYYIAAEAAYVQGQKEKAS